MIESIDPFPWFLNKDVEIKVSGRAANMHIRSSEWSDIWRPLLSRIHDFMRQFSDRLVIGIAGPPAAGKTYFAAQLEWLASKGFLPGARGRAVPMDGFHLPQEILTSRRIRFEDGTSITLAQCKGIPATFDAQSLREHLMLAHDHSAQLDWPDYDRTTHRVVPQAIRIKKSDNIVIVEGNYLFLDVHPYDRMPDFFDLRIYVDCPAPAIISGLVNRHTTGGKTLEEAKDWVRRVDLPNARLIERTRDAAHLIVRRDQERAIAELCWQTPKASSDSAVGAAAVSSPPTTVQATSESA
jgi:pantothenate kinase